MKINNIITNILFKGKSPVTEVSIKTNEQTNIAGNNQSYKTETNSPQSILSSNQINVRTPVSYVKTGEFSIPGVENKAQQFKLSNGQRVVIVPKEGNTYVMTHYSTGALNEPDNMRGISHFIEHNLFNGSERLKPDEYDYRVLEIGGRTNAYTTPNSTVYFITSSLDNPDIETLIKLNAEQVQYPTFPEEQFENEKGIVNSEISMYEDKPETIAYNNMIKNLFQIDSTSTDIVLGNIENINNLTREEVLQYYNEHYSPENAITVIVGNVDVSKTMEHISKYYTKKPPQHPNKIQHETLTPINTAKRIDVKSKNATATISQIGFAGPKNNDYKSKIALELALNLFANPKNSNLAKSLNKLGVSQDYQIERISNKDDDHTCIEFEITAPEEKNEEAIQTFYDELNTFINNPPSQEEFYIAKKKYYNNFIESNECSDNISRFIGEALLSNNSELLKNFDETFNDISLEDIINVLKENCDLSKASVSVVHPKDISMSTIKENYRQTHINDSPVLFTGKKQIEATTTTQNLQTITQICNVSPQNKYFQSVREFSLQNNVQVAINPISGNKCYYTMKLKTPLLKDISLPEFKILEEMLNNGSMFKDKKTFYDELDRNDTNLTFNVSSEGLTYNVKCMNENLQSSFNSVNEVLCNPRFTKEEFETAKSKIRNIIQSTPHNTNEKLMNSLFPDIKAYETKDEMLKSLESITFEQIQSLYSRLYQNTQGHCVFSMPASCPQETENLFLNNILANTPIQQPFSTQLQETYHINSEPKVIVQKEENAQAEISQGYKFKISGNIDDFAKANILNNILGGRANSRLSKDLRETQKLAYAVGSDYYSVGDTGIIMCSIKTTTENPADSNSSPENIVTSLNSFNKHIEKLKTEPVSEEELRQTKLCLKVDLFGGNETNAMKTQNLVDMENTYYGKEFMKEYLDAIDRVTADDLLKSANYIFKNPPVTSIVAGQQTLEQLGLNNKE